KHPGLSDPDGQPQKRDEPDHSAAAPAGSEGSGPRPHRVVCAVRADRALAANRSAATGPRAPPVARGARPARRVVGVRPLLLLLDLVPELLVEPGPLSRPVDPVTVVPLARRQPRSAHWRASRPARGSVPALSLPHDHELHQDLPEGAQPGTRDFQHQAADGRTRVRARTLSEPCAYRRLIMARATTEHP